MRFNILLCLVLLIYSPPLGEYKVNIKTIRSVFKLVKRLKKDKLILKLWETNPINMMEIHRKLKLSASKKHSLFTTSNPYYPQFEDTLGNLKYPLRPKSFEKFSKNIKYYSQEVVVDWNTNPEKNSVVCAVKFIDKIKINYKLQTFPSKADAENADFIVTHKGKCGMCSTLRDLSIYLSNADLTTPARACSQHVNVAAIKYCYRYEIGFSKFCSEQWAYNSEHTRSRCGETCLKLYGLLNILLDQIDRPNSDEDGNLNVCLACDEFKSGPGFKYGAGRTRRNSGITSAIKRNYLEVYKLNHDKYFGP